MEEKSYKIFRLGMILIFLMNLLNSAQIVSAKTTSSKPKIEIKTTTCSNAQDLLNIANQQVLLETQAGNFPNWHNAKAEKPFPYYDIGNHITAYIASIVRNQKILGYVAIDATDCQVIEFSENAPWHIHSVKQAQSIATQWGFSIDTSHPLYLGPFDKYFTLIPKNYTANSSVDDYQLLLNIMDYSYIILDAKGNRLDTIPNGMSLSKPDFNNFSPDLEKGSILNQPIQTASSKVLSVPYYFQFWYGDCWVGCTPNAGATLMGYWAQHGYPNVAWGYDSTGRPYNTVVRLHDLAGTFCDSGSGVTWYSNLSPALTTVFHERGYPGSSSQYIAYPSFEKIRSEIDQGRPVVTSFMGYNGGKWPYPDHSTSGVGYDTTGGNFMVLNPNLGNYYSPVYVSYGANYNALFINTLVPPSKDSAAFVAQSTYPTVRSGNKFSITFDLKNTGTSTWTPGSYWLQNMNGTPLGAGQQSITTNVAPGQTYHWVINMTAPSAPGVYRTQWGISHNGTIFGPAGVSMYIDVTVLPALTPTKTATPILIPLPLTPSGTTHDNTPTYTWQKISGATQYRYQLLQGKITKYTKVVSSTTCTSTTCTHTPSEVLMPSNYAWRIQAMVGGVWRSYSPYKTFTLTILTPTKTKTKTPTNTKTPTPTFTKLFLTSTQTITATKTGAATSTFTSTSVVTSTIISTTTQTAPITSTPTATSTLITPTRTVTPTGSKPFTATVTSTFTPTKTFTPTITPTQTLPPTPANVYVEEPNLAPGWVTNACDNSAWYRFINDRGFASYLTLNAQTDGQSTNSASWRPNIPLTGRWRVEMYNPYHSYYVWPCLGYSLPADTGNALYQIYYNGGSVQKPIDQESGGGTWVDLGTYNFAVGTGGYVTLSDKTGEAFITKYVLFSALRFVYVGP